MSVKRDPVRMLRIVASLAIIIYSYDILLCIVHVINPAGAGPEVAAYFSGESSLTPQAASVRAYLMVSLAITLLLSLFEVHGGIEGLKGEANRLDKWFCLFTGCYAVFLIVMTVPHWSESIMELVEFAVSGLIAFQLWYYSRKVLKMRAAGANVESRATKADYEAGLKVVGVLMMVFGIWNLIQVCIGLIDPSLLSIDADTLQKTPALVSNPVIIATLVVNAVFSAVQIYIGYRGYEKRPARYSAPASLVLFIAMLVGNIVGIVNDGVTSIGDFASVSCAGTLLLYWVYCRKIARASKEEAAKVTEQETAKAVYELPDTDLAAHELSDTDPAAYELSGTERVAREISDAAQDAQELLDADSAGDKTVSRLP